MQEKVEKDYSLEVVKKCWNLCPYILLNYLLFSSWCALQTVRHFLKLLPVSIVSEALFIYDMTSVLADSKMLMAKIHSYLKQCLCNFHFIKTRYFSQNISISLSIQAPGSHEQKQCIIRQWSSYKSKPWSWLGAIFILRKGVLKIFWTTHPPT